MITRDTQVEDLLQLPGAMAFCIQRRVSPFSCHGAYPDTLGRLLERRGVADIDGFLRDLQAAVASAGPP